MGKGPPLSLVEDSAFPPESRLGDLPSFGLRRRRPSHAVAGSLPQSSYPRPRLNIQWRSPASTPGAQQPKARRGGTPRGGQVPGSQRPGLRTWPSLLSPQSFPLRPPALSSAAGRIAVAEGQKQTGPLALGTA
ncbi:hypothetical protein BS78_03G095400 [Paspalum vaginatum]|nr:hypothetical protein BS78_03G095400 [Paspalum vaginatum]